MKILLLSAYDTDSHRSWCQGLMAHLPNIQWHYLSLPGRFFSWRIRGNPLSWAQGKDKQVLQQDFDLILATSMVDLATLRGLAPTLAQIPAMMYFHENQFAYPKSDQQHTSVEPQMVNLYSALSAQRVLFNSEYNRDSFLLGAEKLLKRLPDEVPPGIIQTIEEKSRVLPVPITEHVAPIKVPSHHETLTVIWNHRWEYDKGPELLKAVVDLVESQKLAIAFIIAGLSFRNVPPALQQLQEKHPRCIAHIGTYAQKSDYLSALDNSQVVLSTAHHEFQGLAMLEAAARGCIPLAPDRLAYPEWVPKACLYKNGSMDKQAANIVAKLKHWQQHGLPTPVPVERYFWPSLIGQYLKEFNNLLD